MRKHPFFRRHPGEGTPMILAIVLVLLMLFCTVAEFSRVWICLLYTSPSPRD